MGVRAKRRERKQAEQQVGLEAAIADVIRGVHNTRSLYGSDEAAFEFRAMFLDAFEGALTERLRVLRQIAEARGENGAALYDDEFARHWEGLDRDQRSAELEKLIRFSNLLADAEPSRGAQTQMIAIEALVNTKVQLLSAAYDAVYAHDYSERLMRDQLQFGVADIAGQNQADGAPNADPGFARRAAAMGAAADRLEGELEQAPIDDYFVLMLLACAWGGYQALQVFANTVDQDLGGDASERVRELVAALEAPDEADAGVRATTWLMAARILAMNWPDRRDEVLDVAQIAMPADERDRRTLRELAGFTAESMAADDPSSATMKLERRSLQWIAEKMLGASEDIYDLPAIMVWSGCCTHGVQTYRERLDELEASNPDIRPGPT